MNIFSRIIILCGMKQMITARANVTEWPSIHEGNNPPAIVDWSVADELFKRVRVLCWVMTQPVYHESRAKHVQATWGKRCKKLVFMSTDMSYMHVTLSSVDTVNLPVEEGKDYLWGKTKEAFRYVYEHHRREADWFLKADDDTYVVVENLRYLLADYNPKDPIYFGCRFKLGLAPGLEQGYMSGGAGYVLSREALDRLVKTGLKSKELCRPGARGAEDLELGICLARIGVKAMDSRDQFKRGRFFPFAPKDHLVPRKKGITWYQNIQYYPTEEGQNCCSKHAITFHYVKPDQMYVYDYFIYQLRAYGISYGLGRLPKILEHWNNFTVRNRSK